MDSDTRDRPAWGVSLWLAGCLVLCWSDGQAQTRDPNLSISELKRLSIEQLADIEVTSVSRAEERLVGAAAAVTVVTNEDIRRSGATTVPEALRMVPGIHVARQTSNTWVVSSRGFSGVNSEKLLVLSDTRTIYTPLFSGVFWDVQNYLLQDVDRIEVIRGPGATLWGSNAVNGVINITTKSARETQGLYVETSAGTYERAAAAVRYGGRIGERAHYRLFGSYADRDRSLIPAGPTADDWRLGHLGGRTDWESADGHSLTIQGDVYHGDIGRVSPSVSISNRAGPTGDLVVGVTGGNILGRYHRTAATSDTELRVYYDRTHRDDPSFVDDLHTFDAEFQQRFAIGRRHEVTWGVNNRLTANSNRGKVIFALEPPSSRDNLIGAFAQDQLKLRDSLHLTVGTKVERNDFSGFEMQPSARVSWDLSATHALWAAVSRAVRVPTRLERDIAIDATNPAASTVVRLLGNEDFEAERLLAYEAGYRWQLSRLLSVDFAMFHNRYAGLSSLEIEAPFLETGSGKTIIPIRNRNLTDGHAQGFEVLSTVSPRENWRITASYAYLDLSLDARGQDQNRGRFYEGATPRHQFGLRSFLDLPAHLQLDGQLRSLSAVRRLPPVTSGGGIEGYTELDLRLAWRGWRELELSVIGQSLLRPQHPEFGPVAQRGEVERGVFTRIAWGF